MKFLVDENLPPSLVEVFRQSGVTCKHINSFKSPEPISDNAIRKFSLHYDWIVVSRDDDFVKSFVNRKVPDQLVFVYGIDSKRELLDSFEKLLPELLLALKHYDLIEINPQGLKTHF